MAINPKKVPKRKLYTGEEIPCIGMGTFGSDKYSEEEVSAAVYGAAAAGYRLFDCASVYGNEAQIGGVFKRIFESGIKREDVFITSKVWNDMHGKGDVLISCAKSLKDLKLDYIDLFFIHWPFRNFHARGCTVDSRNPLSHAYVHGEFMETWAQMEKLQKAGYVRNIGVSNMTIPKMKLMLRDCAVRPAAWEMELHPCMQQPELFKYSKENGILPIGYCPLGSPSRPARDMTPDDFVDMEQPEIAEIAKKHNIHPALVCLKWAVQRGQVPIPFSVKEQQYTANLKAVTENPLTDKEMEKLKAVDKNCRLIKGQVFLWEGAADWRILWDEDGNIRE